MAGPPNGPTSPHVHQVQPPPQDDPTTSAAAQILDTAADTAGAVAALLVLLAPLRIGAEAIEAALHLVNRGTKHTPRPKGSTDLARKVAADELYFRAAYLIRAAHRIQADLDNGLSIREAVARERRYYEAHEKARKQRLLAARKVAVAHAWFGPLLGWYLNPLLNNEAECIAANGHNFDALVGTVIGLPGSVHAGCGCYPGPPWEGAGMVDDAVRNHIVHVSARKLQPLRRRKAS